MSVICAGHEDSILCLVYSSETDMLISGSEDNTIRLWPLDETEELKLQRSVRQSVSCTLCHGDVSNA